MRFLLRLITAIAITFVVALIAFRIAAYNREREAADALAVEGSRFVATASGTLHGMEAGPADGPSVLLIHGSVGWAGLWRATLDDLAARGYRAVAIDLPPMGLSDRTADTDYSRQAQGARILAFLEATGVRPVIVAHSFGCGAAVEAMMADPGAFRGAVLVDVALALGKDGTDQALPLPLRPDILREAAVSATVTNPYATTWLFRKFVHVKSSIDSPTVAMLEYPFTRDGTTEALADWLPTLLVPPSGAPSSDPARYASIGLPVALIWGREDTVTPPDQATALQAALGGAPLAWLDDVGHIPQIEAPGAFHDALAAALQTIPED